MYIGLHEKKTHHFCHILMKLELSRQNFDKYSNIKCHENPTVGAELFHADRHI